MTDENRLDQELDRVAGSPALAKAVKKQIIALRGGAAGPQLAEMARDLLEGRIGLRAIAESDAYAQPLIEATNKYQAWYEELDEDERKNLTDSAQRLIDGETTQRE
jgi:hypothetical protein